MSQQEQKQLLDVAENALAGFTRLSEQVYVLDKPQGDGEREPLHPSTVMIYGWGDARPKHVAKYVEGYRRLFPHARIILVFSPILKALLASLPARTLNMQPTLDALLRINGLTEKGDGLADTNILVHCMSNTGGINLAATMNAYAERFHSALPHRLAVLDSTPGSTDFFPNVGRWSRALAVGAATYLPLPFAITRGIAAAFLATLYGANWLIGRINAANFSVAAVNDTRWCPLDAKRLYLYSKEDEIIIWSDIEKHAAEAKERGYAVDTEMFEGTPHVGHMRKHPEQYWAAIARGWEEVVKNVKGKGAE